MIIIGGFILLAIIIGKIVYDNTKAEKEPLHKPFRYDPQNREDGSD